MIRKLLLFNLFAYLMMMNANAQTCHSLEELEKNDR